MNPTETPESKSAAEKFRRRVSGVEIQLEERTS